MPINQKDYQIMNLCLLVILSGILLYLILYPFLDRNHTVQCSYKLITGFECYTCGLTRGMSACIYGNFDAAKKINSASIGVVLFIFIEWIFRIFLSLMGKKLNQKQLVRLTYFDLSTVLLLVLFLVYLKIVY